MAEVMYAEQSVVLDFIEQKDCVCGYILDLKNLFYYSFYRVSLLLRCKRG